jgi:GTP pyrophosphokinase
MDFSSLLIIPDGYSTPDKIAIHQALSFAVNAHGNQKRRSGEPYIIHPIAVANILMAIPAKTVVIQAGLLHDVIEDTHFKFVDIEAAFNFEVAKIVNEVTMVSSIDIHPHHDEDEKAWKYLHHLFLDTIKDVRAALVRLADRLHNMRTLEHLSPDRQFHNAQETLKLYVPLARQIGLPQIEQEYVQLCEKYLTREQYKKALELSVKYEVEILDRNYHQDKVGEWLEE